MVAEEERDLLEILNEVKRLARRYHDLTGKPLGVAGEVAEYEAHRLLGVELTHARQPGYDATEVREGRLVRLQIKGRCLQDGKDKTPRLGSIDLTHEWDALLMVLMDRNLEAESIYEAPKTRV